MNSKKYDYPFLTGQKLVNFICDSKVTETDWLILMLARNGLQKDKYECEQSPYWSQLLDFNLHTDQTYYGISLQNLLKYEI